MPEVPLRVGPERITGKNVPVFCTSRVKGAAHVSTFVVNQNTWGLQGLLLPGISNHPCVGGERRGCAAASQLRAVAMALVSCTPDTTLVLHVTDNEVRVILEQWQAGDTKPPSWYTGGPEGSLMDLAAMVSAASKMITVRRPPKDSVPTRVAILMAEQTLYTMAHQKHDTVDWHLDRKLPAIIKRLPATQ